MNRLIAAIALTLLVGISYFSGFFVINNACRDANNLLNECINAYNSKENAEDKAKNLEEFWSKKEKILSAFANHNEIDKIEMSIRLLRVYSKTNKEEIFNEYHETVKTLIHQLKEDSVPNIHSIL